MRGVDHLVDNAQHAWMKDVIALGADRIFAVNAERRACQVIGSQSKKVHARRPVVHHGGRRRDFDHDADGNARGKIEPLAAQFIMRFVYRGHDKVQQFAAGHQRHEDACRTDHRRAQDRPYLVLEQFLQRW